MERFVALLASGVAEGAIVSLAALGFLLIYKATGVINFAQGDMITLGAYLAIWASVDLHLPIVAAYAVAVGLMFLIGVVLERVAYAPLRGRSIHVVVISTLGAAIATRTLLGIWQGAEPKHLRSPASGKVLHLAGAAIAYQRVVIVTVTVVVVTVLLWMFHRTGFGRQLRAVAADREVARLYGIRVNRLSMLAFGLSAALAGVAGVLIGPLGSVDLTLGFPAMLAAFAASILGGFGSLNGAVAGALVIGLVERTLGGYVLQDYAVAFPYVLMILVVALRPQGFFSREVGSRL